MAGMFTQEALDYLKKCKPTVSIQLCNVFYNNGRSHFSLNCVVLEPKLERIVEFFISPYQIFGLEDTERYSKLLVYWLNKGKVLWNNFCIDEETGDSKARIVTNGKLIEKGKIGINGLIGIEPDVFTFEDEIDRCYAIRLACDDVLEFICGNKIYQLKLVK